MKNLTIPAQCVVLIVSGHILGCANFVDGSAETRIQRGRSERIVSPPDYQLHLTEEQVIAAGGPDLAAKDPAVRLRAMAVTTLTTRTPRTEEQVQSVLPYSPLREMVEFLSSPFYLFWAVPTSSWDQFFAMSNPALNSESMWKGSHVERVMDSHPIAPTVEVEDRVDRLAMPIEIQLDALPALRVATTLEGDDTRVAMADLLTGPLLEAPTTLLARMRIEGQGEPALATQPVQPDLGTRLKRAQRFLLDPFSGDHPPAELAAAVLRLSELGFEERSSLLRRDSGQIFGTQTMDREIASEYMRIARNQKNVAIWPIALENIAAARALDDSVQPEWDQLEADVFEKQALESLGAGHYDLARAGLLKAATVDPARQQRLAPYITMSIEASDRATERQATQLSRDARLAIERDRADAELAIARSTAARRAQAALPAGMTNGSDETD